MNKKRLNHIRTGLITGIVLPFLFFLLILLVKKGAFSMAVYFREMHEIGALPRLLSLCLLPNLLLFFIFMWLDWLKSARGVILSMFVVGVVIIVLKII
jgi:hypothetical protein